MSTTPFVSINIDEQEIQVEEGSTLYKAAQFAGKSIPTLCYDERLKAFGGCRLCVVEIEGQGNPVASCTTPVHEGMVVHTQSEALYKHRKTILEMVASENRETEVDELHGYASQELSQLLTEYEVQPGRFQGAQSGQSHESDPNPFILRDYDNCISCYRCVRVCAEQEGDFAINIVNRGFQTQISTEFNNTLKESSCTFCGQCVQTCPTGALGDKKALRAADLPEPVEKTRSVCTYCGVGCSVDILSKGDKIIGIHPAMDGAANEGALCVKGQFAFDFVQHSERLKTPLVRGDDGKLHETTWEEGLDRAAEGLRRALQEHGRESWYGIASGRAPIEAVYTLQKLIRAGTGTNHIDNCSRS